MSKVIIACDFSSKQELKKFLKPFKGQKLFLKVGYELFYKEGIKIIKWLKSKNHQVFLDLKLHDIPNTVAKGVKNLAKLNVDFLTIHASGGLKMLQQAKEATANSQTKLLAVTQLTSTSEAMLNQELLITNPLNEVVLHYATLASQANIDGIVCSAKEAKQIKKINKNLIIVTPGIRFNEDARDDQIRITTPGEAKNNGSTYIVVGRPITKAKEPLKSYEKFSNEFNK